MRIAYLFALAALLASGVLTGDLVFFLAAALVCVLAGIREWLPWLEQHRRSRR